MKQHGVRGRQSRSTSSRASILAPKDRVLPAAATGPIERKRTKNTSRLSSNTRSVSRPSATISLPIQHVQDEEDTDESLEHVVMAIDKTNKGLIGCAYYIAQEELLCYVEPIVNGGFEAIEILRIDIQPTVILVSPRIDHADLGAGHTQTQRHNSLVADDNGQRLLPYELVLRPGPDFKYENAVNKLSTMQVLGAEHTHMRFLVPGENMEYGEDNENDETGLTDQTGRFLHTSGQIDVDSRLSIGCVGAVVAYLQRRRALEYLQDDPDAKLAYRILRVQNTTLKNTMLVNADTLASLQIIQPEFHPNVANQGPGNKGSKESLSIYGLFHYLARTPQGRTRLRQMFLRPSTDINEIESRHAFVTVGTTANNQTTCQRLSKSLSRVKNMRGIVVNLHKGIEGGNRPGGKIKSGVWTAILEFCYHTIDIANALKELEGSDRLLFCVRLGDKLDMIQLQRLGKLIHDIIDLDQSAEQCRTVIKRNVDQDLDNVKDVYDGMEATLWQIAREISNSMPPEIEVALNVMFLPQLGFHIVVPLSKTSGQPVYDGAGTHWERIFTTEEHAYFKDVKMREMDTYMGDLYAVICDREIEISHDLAQRVLGYENLLVVVSDLCGELDALLALVHGATQYNLVRPRMVNENIISIKGGRHILQEMTVPSFVPNDIVVAGGHNEIPNMLLLTGPNFSGKSVFMKQVALIGYMAQAGSFVPAASAQIGITDKILTRITTCETVSKVQSAFMIDLQQITRALNSCTSRSLLVIDELGKGTDACDGTGLAAAVFEYLLSMGDKCPKVLASTHFHEIFQDGRFEKYPNLAFAHMEVHIEQKQREVDGHCSDVAYLYNLRQGRSTLSYGNQCAAINGVPGVVVQRASLLSDLILQGADLVAVCATLPVAELEELRNAEILARRFLNLTFEPTSATASARATLDEVFESDEVDGWKFSRPH